MLTDMQLKVQKPLKDLVYLELKHKILTREKVSESRQMENNLAKKSKVNRRQISEDIKRLH